MTHHWRFALTGGFDQVRIETDADLRALRTLDPKLWAVLACPTQGLELDEVTLKAIDTDGDGVIRLPELLATVDSVCDVVSDLSTWFETGESLPLASLNAERPHGAQLQAAAQAVCERKGLPADAVSLASALAVAQDCPPDLPNGDGVVPLARVPEGPVRALLEAVLAHASGPLPTDRSGQPGVDEATLDAFVTQAQAVLAWRAQAPADDATLWPWGEQTPAAVAAIQALRAKLDDYFTRCELSAFDGRAQEALNPAAAQFEGMAGHILQPQADSIDAMPLAQVHGQPVLRLDAGINPAWVARVQALRVFHAGDLSRSQWEAMKAQAQPHVDWLAQRPACTLADAGAEQLASWLDDRMLATLRQHIADDVTQGQAVRALDELIALLRLRRDLVPLLCNFVNFSDFYSDDRLAIFQAGTLYLDQRSCQLCLRVNDMARHAKLAPLSGTYLVYCQCTRQGEAPITVVAALTGGDADDMMVPGRNGVFYDRQGRDWSASVVKVVEAPISVSQAFWMPYRRIARLIGGQIQKLAAAGDKAVTQDATAQIDKASAAAAKPEAAKPAAFDIARFAGIFAAIGLALGAVGSALAAIFTGFLALAWWQMPMVILGVVLFISGPSMVLAWFKLRQRNLGPLLDANGWAVNIRARINLSFGASLTQVAALPAGAHRSLVDPYADKRRSGWVWVLAGLALALGWYLWQRGAWF